MPGATDRGHSPQAALRRYLLLGLIALCGDEEPCERKDTWTDAMLCFTPSSAILLQFKQLPHRHRARPQTEAPCRSAYFLVPYLQPKKSRSIFILLPATRTTAPLQRKLLTTLPDHVPGGYVHGVISCWRETCSPRVLRVRVAKTRT